MREQPADHPIAFPGRDSLFSASVETGNHARLAKTRTIQDSQDINRATVSAPLRLYLAGNPFDFHDLLLSGIKDWSRTSDALIDGASVPGVLGLFEAGLRSGRLEMLLILHANLQNQSEWTVGISPGGVAPATPGPLHLKRGGEWRSIPPEGIPGTLEGETALGDIVLQDADQRELGIGEKLAEVGEDDLNVARFHGSVPLAGGPQIGQDGVGDGASCDDSAHHQGDGDPASPARGYGGYDPAQSNGSKGSRHDSLLSPASLPQIFGFDIISVSNGWLNGHLLYLRPEHRGRGFVRRYFEAAFDLACRRGLRGFQFFSTLKLWDRESSIFSKELYWTQADGTPVYRYWRKAE